MKHVNRWMLILSSIVFSVVLLSCGGGGSDTGGGGAVDPSVVGLYRGSFCVSISQEDVPVSDCTPFTMQVTDTGQLNGGATGGGTRNPTCSVPQPPTFVRGTTIVNNDSYTCTIQGQSCTIRRSLRGSISNNVLSMNMTGTMQCSVSGTFVITGTWNLTKFAKAMLKNQKWVGLGDTGLLSAIIQTTKW